MTTALSSRWPALDAASVSDRPRVFIANRADGDQVRVNIRSTVNAAKIRREKRNGRDVIIVPSATLPDDVVMNSILYPADEIEKSFKGLERTPAPLGHPTINGKFVSARDPEGINVGWIGAWNENLRREKGRVLLDKVIDVERANQSEGGRAVLAAIEQGGPVHTSTGLLCNLEAANGDVDYKHIARNIEFDHDAILLDEDGAATPEQGVGMMVNSAGQEIEVINSSLTEEAERGLDWAIEHLAQALERRERASWLEQFRSAVLKLIPGSERANPANQKEDDMTVSKEQFDALSGEVKTLSESLGKIGETITEAVANAVTAAVKPLTDAQEALANSQKAKDEEELTALREKIVKANLMDEAAAGELTLNAARALAKQAEPKKALGLNAATGQGGEKPSFQLPKGDE